ncbi:MAG: iron-siderophore ABC transporter substrate-binding protein [Cyanobacteria bacterium P01_D01_bin.73]
MGTTEIPVLRSLRVVTIDTGPLDTALALGIEPVGTIRYGEPPRYLGKAAEKIPVIGQYNEPNMESILRLKPDLILGSKSISAGIYPQLLKIAPAIFVEGAGFDWQWKDNFKLFAKALGKSERADKLLTGYHTKLSDLKKSLNLTPQDIVVSVLVFGENGVIAQTPRSFSGSILKEIGFSRNEIQGNEDQFFVRISREDIKTPDGDVIFLMHSPTWDTASAEEFVSDPVLSTLKAVRKGAVCEVSGDVWGSGRGILAAQKILDDVRSCFTKET